jgi:hypothetical protein
MNKRKHISGIEEAPKLRLKLASTAEPGEPDSQDISQTASRGGP